MENPQKYYDLLAYIRQFPKVAVAFSGGVDSTFLLAASKEAIGAENVTGITIDAPSLPRYELEEAQNIAQNLGVKHIIIISNEIEDNIRFNPIDRCYHCKKVEFGTIIAEARKLGISVVFDGSNADDKQDYRPGQKAIKELSVVSPLLQLNITKAEIREYSRHLNLPTWNKPAYACLYSRFPYNTEIKREDLIKVEKAEKFLIDKGFKTIRVRCHNDLARIEIHPSQIQQIISPPLAEEIHQALVSFGFKYVTVDILGYRMGSYNQVYGIKA
ncbi:MAG TPA: ATP-dependent sacrificial sulfur transferase LarE [Bacteroidales bacterium]|nr:ATP-dependent sacrificial sulfur transferase LarE [Bacteroidales bacterium]HOK98872.1 ATP-dependent sacrificial sulfur transferase LarE [Bacteroidales bacterium]HPO65762.1 ATP-dependent sacrificial sulfur transferase LarE [Bacteroidales bacterium]